MNHHGLATHTVNRHVFDAVARARGGRAAVEQLSAGQLSKRVLLLAAVHRHVVEHAPAAARQAGVAEAYHRITRMQWEEPARWRQSLLEPYTGVWLADCLQHLHRGSPADLRGFDRLARAKGRGATPRPGAYAVHLESGGKVLHLRIDDGEHYRQVYGKPLAGPLSPAALHSWQTTLREAWDVLAGRHPWHADMIATGLTTLVPLRPKNDGTAVSAAARHAFGAVAASLPNDPVLMALTLVHEFLHVQLGALMDLVPMCLPDQGVRYRVQWRPDPRPAGAVLQGVYAHLGVTDFWRTELLTEDSIARTDRSRATREFSHWRRHTLDAARALLSSDQLTSAGAAFVAEMAGELVRWGDTPLPS